MQPPASALASAPPPASTLVRAAIFDLDGTLADTSADLIAAANATFGAAGLGAPMDPVGDRGVALRGGRPMLRAGLERLGLSWPEGELEAHYARLLDFYRLGIAERTRLYAGVEAALEALAAAGWRLGVCTNKPVALAETLLDRLGLGRYFSALLGADSLDVRKPDPRHLLETIARAGGTPGRAVLIGDTETDRAVAAAAGVPCVLVGFGPEGAALADLGPAALFDDYRELPALLDRLVPQIA
jgi:phosphoglycolate phosphatase